MICNKFFNNNDYADKRKTGHYMSDLFFLSETTLQS